MDKDKLLRIRIKPSFIEKVGSVQDFVIAVQLGRVVNSLRSNLRSQLYVRNDPLLQAKDRFDLLMIQGGMLYEAIKDFPINGKRLSELQAWGRKKQKIKMLNRQKSDNISFYYTVLKTIRNKMFFHFDSNVISDAIKSCKFEKCTSFGVGKSDKKGDFVYTLCDDMLLNCLLSKYDEKIAGLEKYDMVRKEIIQLSDVLCNVYDNCIKELLQDKVDFVLCNKSFGSECDIEKICCVDDEQSE